MISDFSRYSDDMLLSSEENNDQSLEELFYLIKEKLLYGSLSQNG